MRETFSTIIHLSVSSLGISPTVIPISGAIPFKGRFKERLGNGSDVTAKCLKARTRARVLSGCTCKKNICAVKNSFSFGLKRKKICYKNFNLRANFVARARECHTFTRDACVCDGCRANQFCRLSLIKNFYRFSILFGEQVSIARLFYEQKELVKDQVREKSSKQTDAPPDEKL